MLQGKVGCNTTGSPHSRGLGFSTPSATNLSASPNASGFRHPRGDISTTSVTSSRLTWEGDGNLELYHLKLGSLASSGVFGKTEYL